MLCRDLLASSLKNAEQIIVMVWAELLGPVVPQLRDLMVTYDPRLRNALLQGRTQQRKAFKGLLSLCLKEGC
jgi:hypothetical protein